MHRILIVDEEPGCDKTVREALRDEGVQIAATGDIQGALDLLSSNNYDLVLMNANLPGPGRSIIAGRLKEGLLKHTPIIYLSEEAPARELIESYLHEAEDYIVRPFSHEELKLRIKARIKTGGEIRKLQHQLKKADLLFKAGQMAQAALNQQELAEGLLPLFLEAFEAGSAAVSISSEISEPTLAASLGEAAESDLQLLSRHFSTSVLHDRKVLVEHDFQKNSQLNSIPLSNRKYFRTMFSLPLFTEEEEIGTLEVYNVPEYHLKGESILRELEKISSEVSKLLLIANRFHQTYAQLHAAVTEISAIYEISEALGSTLNLSEILKLIVQNGMSTFNAQVVSLMLLDREEGTLKINSAEGLSPEIIENTRVQLGEGIAGKVAKTGQPLLLVDFMDIERPDIEKGVKSALSVPLKIKNEVVGVLNVSKTSRYKFTENDLKLLFNLASLAAQAIERASLYQDLKESLDEMENTYISTITALSAAVDAKDPYTQGHVHRVTRFGMAIAMELDPNLLNDDMFHYALVLHDVGKIGVPDNVLTKPGPLSPDEWEMIKTHPEVGARIISPIKFLHKAVEAVQFHQERYDGKGYPTGRKGEEIPLVARIISVADAFDAMTTDRIYRKALTLEEARNEIIKNSGTQFDPLVVKAFLAALDKGLFH
jgi:response regulator RpfG family c-di-GMP phosphodiesterase